MKKRIFQMNYASHKVRYTFTYPATRYEFHPWAYPVEDDENVISANHDQIELARQSVPEDSKDAYVEFRALIGLTAKALLQYDCCIFHSVAFVWDEKAYLLAAPSGTGKTTQYLNWQRLFPDEISMINGDMPVLERREDGSIWVHPSPWSGKERLGSKVSAPVDGIVLLKQDHVNSISALLPGEALMPLFQQFLVRPDTENQIRALSRIMDQLLRTIPVWIFHNTGDDSSTIMLRDTLMGGKA